MVEWLYALIQAVILAALAPLIQGFVRTLKARLQNRRGPGILQPYYNLAKLLSKDMVVSQNSSWLFWITPLIYFGATFAVAAILPLFDVAQKDFADLFLLVELLALGRFFLSLASLDTGSSFTAMGASRELFVSVLVEPALFLAFLAAVGSTGSTGLYAMSRSAESHPITLPFVLATVAFFFVVIAECGRIPVDNPDTHLELTMFHEGMTLEYSGRFLALIEWASMLKQAAVLTIFVQFFLPWNWIELIPWPIFWVGVKVFLAAALMAAVETSTVKMRVFNLASFLAASGLLSLLALVAK